MIILVLNCGSSSLKYQLLDMKNDEVYDLLAKGLVERIGMETGCLKHQATGKEKLVKEMPIEDHTVGIRAVMDALLDKEFGVLTTLEDIEAVGHRVVHGAEEFVCSQLITDKVIAQLEKCSVFAPLHNPANLLGIKAVTEVLPTVPQVGVFDTAFHQTMPAYAYMYALPYEYSRNTVSVVTVSMVPATDMYLQRVRSSQDLISRTRRSSHATLETEALSQL